MQSQHRKQPLRFDPKKVRMMISKIPIYFGIKSHAQNPPSFAYVPLCFSPLPNQWGKEFLSSLHSLWSKHVIFNTGLSWQLSNEHAMPPVSCHPDCPIPRTQEVEPSLIQFTTNKHVAAGGRSPSRLRRTGRLNHSATTGLAEPQEWKHNSAKRKGERKRRGGNESQFKN